MFISVKNYQKNLSFAVLTWTNDDRGGFVVDGYRPVVGGQPQPLAVHPVPADVSRFFVLSPRFNPGEFVLFFLWLCCFYWSSWMYKITSLEPHSLWPCRKSFKFLFSSCIKWVEKNNQISKDKFFRSLRFWEGFWFIMFCFGKINSPTEESLAPSRTFQNGSATFVW